MGSCVGGARLLTRTLTLALAAAAAAVAPSGADAQARSGGNGWIYLATYEPSLQVIRESDLTVVQKIPMASGVPATIQGLSPDQNTFYMLTIDYETVEVIDRARGASVNTFTLSERNTRVRIRSMAVHPDGRHAVLMIRRDTKLRDRWDVSDHVLVLYDMTEKRVVREIPWPDGRTLDAASFTFSPDGRHLYFFLSDVRIYDTETYAQVDRWDYRGVLGPGLGDFSFSFPVTYREEPGWHTGLFTVRDPIHDRPMMAFARANPTLRQVEYKILGPQASGPRGRVSFSITADRRRAYGLNQEIENYQIWWFDLVEGRAGRATHFPGFPRMEIESSSNGQLIYVYNAGNTIDAYDSSTYRHVRRVELDADMIRDMWVLPAAGR